MRKLAFLFLVSCILSTVAQAAGARVTSFTVDRESVVTGDALTVTVRLANPGSEDAKVANLNILNSYGVRMLPLSSSASAGWSCSPMFTACFATKFAAGAEAVIVMEMLAPATIHPLTAKLELTAALSAETAVDFEHNRPNVLVTLQPSTRSGDLSIALGALPNPIAEGAPITITLDVRNEGPSTLTNVVVPISFEAVTEPQVGYSGSGWTCQVHTARSATCRHGTIEAGVNKPLELSFSAPPHAAELVFRALVFADQQHKDANSSNEAITRTLFVGNESDWTRILFPLTAYETPGANGALWKTDLPMLVDSEEQIIIEPNGCGPVEDPCGPVSYGILTDARGENMIVGQAGSQFIYVAREHAAKVSTNTRVYDAARNDETAGAFVPSARDKDFSVNGFSLVGIPVAEQFRSMLRIYDFDARDNAKVLVELYSLYGLVPFYSEVQTLHVAPGLFRMTTAQLPSHPATAQIDLGPLIPQSNGLVRVTVRPVDPGLRLWGFVSVTNNETHHVTVVAP